MRHTSFSTLGRDRPSPSHLFKDKPRAPRESVAGRLNELGRIASLPFPIALSATLILVAGNLASHELHSSSSIAAFVPSVAH